MIAIVGARPSAMKVSHRRDPPALKCGMVASPPTPTQLLLAWQQGEASAMDRLLPLVEGELRRLARRYMAGERPGHTLQPTALVNEAYLRLIEIKQVRWQNRAHFVAMAARTMRRILVDYARAHDNKKRGGGAQKVTLTDAAIGSSPLDDDLVALDEALTKLAVEHGRKAQVVELKFFGGLDLDETAEALHVSRDTVKRDWRFAKAWLRRALSEGNDL
jgi:RNA polymerase sigma factor (TIGR02999 family)